MLLEANNIGCIRGDQYLFRNLNFRVGLGELLSIQGQNGAGKTTLLKVLAGLILPDKGKVTLQAKAPKGQLAFLGHRDGINVNLTVMENIHLQLALANQKIDENLLKSVLAEFNLSHKSEMYCYQLSQGQRRKVALCCLLLKQKPLWILDEPFTSLDSATMMHFTQMMQAHLSNGLIVMTSHHGVTLAHKAVQL